MKELQQNEIMLISGAGVDSKTMGNLGLHIGGIIDAGLSFFNKSSVFSSAVQTLFTGIGYFIEAKISDGIKELFNGATQIVKAVTSISKLEEKK